MVSSRSAATSSTSSARPRTARPASSCSATRSSRSAGFRPSPSARSTRPSVLELDPAAELALEHRELAEIADRGGRASRCRVDPADRPLRRPARPDRRRHRGRARRRRGDPGGASRPLGGRDDGDARRGCAPPLRRRRRAARRARRAQRPRGRRRGRADESFRAQSRHLRGAIHRRGRVAAGEGPALRLPDRRRLREPRRGRAHAIQPQPDRVAFPRGHAGRGRLGPPCRGAALRWFRLAGAAARRHPVPSPCPPPPRRGAYARWPRADGDLCRPARRRLRRPRGPRHRPLRRLRDQDACRRHPRLPRARVQGRRQGLRAHRAADEDHAATSASGGEAPQLSALGSKRWDAVKARARRAARELAGRAAQPLRRAPGAQGPRVRARRRVAARAGALVPLSRDGRPDRRDRGGQGRHGVRPADGPADLRRRRLRQDRGRAARRPQGRGRGQAGDDAGADHDPGPAAPRHLPRAPADLAARDRDGLAAAQAGRGPRGARASSPTGGSTS